MTTRNFTRSEILAAVQQGIAQGLLIAVADDGTGREVAAAEFEGREIVLTMEGFEEAEAATAGPITYTYTSGHARVIVTTAADGTADFVAMGCDPTDAELLAFAEGLDVCGWAKA